MHTNKRRGQKSWGVFYLTASAMRRSITPDANGKGFPMSFAEQIDKYVLERLCTPLAHWIQISTGVISYQIACELFLLGLLSACVTPIAAFIIGGISPVAVLLTALCIFVGLLYLVCYVLLSLHLQMATPWKNEPVLVKVLTRAGAGPQVMNLIGALVITYLLISIGWNANEKPLPKNPEPYEYLARSVAFLLMAWLVNTLMTVGTYFARVRPLPPSDVEKRETNEVLQGT